MNAEEYEKVKNLRYRQYCDYLQEKYGLPKKAYMNELWSKSQGQGTTRTREGLFIHHIREDVAVMLSDPAHAKENPYEYQLPKNLCYCDWLEHLYLHVLICEAPVMRFDGRDMVGIGGITAYLVPELNDMYSGCNPGKPWRVTCFKKVADDKDVYVKLVQRFIRSRKNKEGEYEMCAAVYSSAKDGDGWRLGYNYPLWGEIVSPFMVGFRRRRFARKKHLTFEAFTRTNDPKKRKRRRRWITFGIVVLVLVVLTLAFW
ncbi:MAG: hypothetical protein LUD72_05190 [Bacteroidales bacterium]|nr:hypothetical protein [Bacteroidales bacterium]